MLFIENFLLARPGDAYLYSQHLGDRTSCISGDSLVYIESSRTTRTYIERTLSQRKERNSVLKFSIFKCEFGKLSPALIVALRS